MQLTTTPRRGAALAALAAITGSAALAGTASAATFEKGPVLAPGATIPVDFPGYREPGDKKLKGGSGIVEVRAPLARDERSTMTIMAPKCFKFVTLAFDLASQLGART